MNLDNVILMTPSQKLINQMVRVTLLITELIEMLKDEQIQLVKKQLVDENRALLSRIEMLQIELEN